MDPSSFLLWCRSYHPSKSKSPINGLCNCLSLCQLPPFPPHRRQKKSLYPLVFLFLSLCLQAFVSFPHNVLEKRNRCSQLVLCPNHKEPKSVTSLSSHGNRMWCHPEKKKKIPWWCNVEKTCKRCISALATASLCAERIEENALSNKLCINPLPQLLQYGNPSFFRYLRFKGSNWKMSLEREMQWT